MDARRSSVCQKALELLQAAGFREVEIKRVEADILNSYYVARKL